MTTPIALRDWRLLAAGCGGLLLLAAAITLHSHWGDFSSGVSPPKLPCIAIW